MLNRLLFWIIFLLVVGGAVWSIEAARLPCQTPISYRVGQFDPNFGISQAEFLKTIREAEAVWEKDLGRELFIYDSGAQFPINLVFDERQERTKAQEQLEAKLAANAEDRSTIASSYQSLADQYERANRAYEVALVEYERKLAAYNRSVAEWNASDRTNEAELKEVRNEEKELRRQSQNLEEQRQSINALVPKVNALARSEQEKVNEYNAQVADFADHYGTGGEFEQGLYTGTEINIYQFDDVNHLRAVLVHELGHALALDHVNNPRSLMYPLLKDQVLVPLTLSAEDRTVLRTECQRSTSDQIKQDFQKWLDFWQVIFRGASNEVSVSH